VRALDAAGTLERHDAELARRLRAPLPRRHAAPRDWVATWTAWLADFGWPGARTLDSAEWQARDAWHALLVDFATLDEVARSVDGTTALAALRALARETIWAPRTGGAPVQILGVLEAAGLSFDALWLAGFSADAWPAPPRPNPFLPLGWPRARGVPRASAARELGFAQALTTGLAHAAGEVVVSHAREVGDAPRVVSPLFAAWPLGDGSQAAMRLRDHVAAAGVAPLAWQDDEGPPLPIGADAGGGTGLIESQSTCPFQAFARYRLDTEAWPEPDEGLTPMERGTLLHFAMAAFWTDVRDHATLMTLDAGALETRVARAVAQARSKLPAARWRSLAPAIAAGEAQRLTHTIIAWITRHERTRAPFTVKAVESDARLTLGGVRLRLKIDRVDAVEPDGVAIIDYKSGRTTAPSSWFKPRPAGTQVGLYTLAQRAAAPTRAVRAAAYAQIKSGEIRICGVADDAAPWPGLVTPQRVLGENASWRDVEAFWLDKLPALGDAFRRGVARVQPRAPTACQRCDLQPFCRIENLYDDDAQELAPPHDDV
jgi:probable DNA repair protein